VKKKIISSKDKKDWKNFVENIDDIPEKDIDSLSNNLEKSRIKKLDLHGFSLEEANKTVEKFIIESFDKGLTKLLIVTGKGSRSKSYENPYLSEKLSILKNSIPNFIRNNRNLSSKIKDISKANLKDGGEGAINVFLKKNLENKFR
tara:strand:+ start:200 stop:637 length:438 start_codon:yes stop_codon:yes gene_type:complete